MSEPALLDNDAALKLGCYALVEEALSVTTIDGQVPAMLGVGRFVVLNRVRRSSRLADKARASEAVESLLDAVVFIEPEETELQLAAELEARASEAGLELDGGESQLLAVMASRGNPLLATGDKRAIIAMAKVAASLAAARVACLEQLIAQILAVASFDHVRGTICAEPGVDQALSICFQDTGSPPPKLARSRR